VAEHDRAARGLAVSAPAGGDCAPGPPHLSFCPALTAPPEHVQKLGLKRAQPEAACKQYVQQSVAGVVVTNPYANAGIRRQSDATVSAAPTEVQHVSPPFEHYSTAGAMQGNNSMGTASGNLDYKVSVWRSLCRAPQARDRVSAS
jgi:hypothetical protein